MTTKRGRKDTAVLTRRTNPFALGPGQTYVATRPIAVGDLILPADVEVPADKLGPRPEAWVRSRRLRIVGPDESFIAYDAFRETVEMAIDEAEQLLEQHRPPPAEEDAAPKE